MSYSWSERLVAGMAEVSVWQRSRWHVQERMFNVCEELRNQNDLLHSEKAVLRYCHDLALFITCLVIDIHRALGLS